MSRDVIICEEEVNDISTFIIKEVYEVIGDYTEYRKKWR